MKTRGCGRVLAVAALLVSMAAGAVAQGPFRITYDVDRTAAGRSRVTGQVFNESPSDALDVYVTAEALDARGKTVARGVTFVSGNIRQGTSAPFEAVVPAPASTVKFRVRVSGYQPGLSDSGQAP